MKLAATSAAGAGLALALGCPILTAGPVWDEMIAGGGDAGSLPAFGQPTFGVGLIERIDGSLLGLSPAAGPDFEDLFLIRIVNPGQFSAQTFQPPGGATFNTQLWLFTLDAFLQGFGRVGNDDAPGFPLDGSILLPDPDDGFLLPPLAPGVYALAISGFNNDPVSAGGPIFNQGVAQEISGPDGPGGLNPITGWNGGPTSDTGDYQIALTGAAFLGPPCPDTDGNFEIDVEDLINIVTDWGCKLPGPCVGDVNGDGITDVDDLIAVILAWGPCGSFSECDCVEPIDLIEPEACGADENGGCNSTPPAFTDAACSGAWCGTAWAQDGIRDTDWYLVSLSDGDGPVELIGWLSSQFLGTVFIVDGIDDCNPLVIGSALSEACEPQPAIAKVAPGTYVVFVATEAFAGVPCNSGENAYRLVIDCRPLF